MSKSPKKRGFTLIELLVVIAIIAMLLSILLPALKKAKVQAQAVICRSQMKQMGTGLQSYYTEYNGKALVSEGAEEFWFLQIAPYMGDSKFRTNNSADPETELSSTMKVLKCPSTKPPLVEWIAGTNPRDHGLGSWGNNAYQYRYHSTRIEGSYGINTWIGGWTGTNVSSGTIGIYDPRHPDYNENMAKTFRCHGNTEPTVPSIAESAWVESMPQDTDAKPPIITMSYIRGDLAGDPPRAQPSVSVIARNCIDRHNMAINVTFGDSSCRSVALKDLWTLRWSKVFRPDFTVKIPY